MYGSISAIAFFAGLAAAVHAPVGDPKGNAFVTPGRAEIVPACKPFKITWLHDSPNKVSLLLLRGPSTNVVPIGAPIAEGIANTGSFTWTPDASLEADTTHYGIQLIDDVDGHYQYTDQFGISKDASCKSEANVTSSASGYPTSTPSATLSASSKASSKAVTTEYATSTAVPTIVSISSGFAKNSTVIQPTGTLTVPSSLLTTATGAATGAASATVTGPAQATGAAGHVQAGLGLAGAIAGLVMML